MVTTLDCLDSVSGPWVALAGAISHWLVQPYLVIPIALLLVGLLNLLPRHGVRRILQLTTLTLIATYCLALSPPTVNLAEKMLTQRIPLSQNLETSDAIVVLGRGNPLNASRVAVVEQLWAEHRAPLIFASGIWDAPRMLSQLHEYGIPDAALQGEACSRTTYENAKYTAMLLKPQNVQQIVLVTDAPHLWRSTLTFQGFRFKVIPVASSRLDPLPYRDRTRVVWREYLGLASYSLLGRLSSPPGDSRIDSD